jgi:hypothetical protein
MLLNGQMFVLQVQVLIVLRQYLAIPQQQLRQRHNSYMLADNSCRTAAQKGKQLEAAGGPLCARGAVTLPEAADGSRLDVYVHEDVIVLPHASL